jgi:DNA-3-methyladenine glycosylase I
VVGDDGVSRCWWGASHPVYVPYHDREWGFPTCDDRYLFEKLCLEGFQAGLSWLTVLRKRENFRRAFADFDADRLARFDARRVQRLLADPGIVRHRGKIESAIHNARRALALRDDFGSLAAYLWGFQPPASERPRRFSHANLVRLTETPTSRALSRDLKSRGFRFVGPTTMYAFMQSVGIVNDHLDGCAARPRAETARRRFAAPRPRGA